MQPLRDLESAVGQIEPELGFASGWAPCLLVLLLCCMYYCMYGVVLLLFFRAVLTTVI